MEDDAVMQEFEDAGAILKGHFRLSSGLHSDTYLQCARVLMNAARGERLCRELARRIRKSDIGEIDMVVAPAMGGVVVGYELARQLGIPGIFCERENGRFAIRRGFSFPEGSRILMVEDVVTTGKSSLEAMECVKEHGGVVVGEASLVNRNAGGNPLPVPLVSLLNLVVPVYEPEKLPPHLQTIPVQKPGSRWLKG